MMVFPMMWMMMMMAFLTKMIMTRIIMILIMMVFPMMKTMMMIMMVFLTKRILMMTMMAFLTKNMRKRIQKKSQRMILKRALLVLLGFPLPFLPLSLGASLEMSCDGKEQMNLLQYHFPYHYLSFILNYKRLCPCVCLSVTLCHWIGLDLNTPSQCSGINLII